MSRDIPPLPWTDPSRLWMAAAIASAAIAASAVYGVIGSLLRNYPQPFTTDQGDKT